jgi:cysteine-rich repeat protein
MRHTGSPPPSRPSPRRSARLVAAVPLAAVLALAGAGPAAALPDLVPEPFDPRVVVQDVPPGDVEEGCAGGTTSRRLVRFSLLSRNLGPDDLVVGSPGCPPCHQNPGALCDNPLFVCSTAHGHAHFQSFILPELVDEDGVLVAQGYKFGFCLLDSACTGRPPQFTNCANQGISAGCADLYAAHLPCQYVDITDVDLPPGRYRLRVTIDPLDHIEEADEDNNVAEVEVVIEPPTCTAYAPADLPQAIPDLGAAVSAVTVPAGGAVSDVNVIALEGTHPSVGDLTVRLTSPAGTEVTLVDGVCGGDAGFVLSLDDAATSAIPCPPASPERHRPAEPLSTFAGEDAAGTWTLSVVDGAAPHDGALAGWTLQVCSCGDGALDAGEECDDGNTAAGDGCDAACRVESCAACAGAPSVCTFNRSCRRCQRAVAAEAARYAQARAKHLAQCELARVKGKHASPCPNPEGGVRDPGRRAADRIARALARLRTAVGKRCGGADKACGGDLAGEELPAAIGFPPRCPNFEDNPAPDCHKPVSHCGEALDCLACLHETAVDQAIDLYFGELLPAQPLAERPLNRCQRAIGKTQQVLALTSRERQRCWDARLRGKHADACPDATAPAGSPARRAAERIAGLTAKHLATICRACGGADRRCGGADDLDPQSAIGFADACDDVSIPGGASCAAPVETLQDLVDCVSCVTDFKVACMDAAGVPALVPYPDECNP